MTDDQRLCHWCGAPINTWHPNRSRNYCDPKCRNDYWQDVKLQKAKEARPLVSCIVCDKPTKNKYRYCGKTCSARALEIYRSMRNLARKRREKAADEVLPGGHTEP